LKPPPETPLTGAANPKNRKSPKLASNFRLPWEGDIWLSASRVAITAETCREKTIFARSGRESKENEQNQLLLPPNPRASESA